MHTFIRRRRRGLMIVVAIMLVRAAWAYEVNPLDLVMTREHPQTYQPGETIEITVIVNAAVQAPARAMGVREMLPEGWTFVAARGYGDDTPGLLPPVGAGPELEFAWIVAPYLPYAFSYLVAIPERDGGDKTIFGAVEYRLDDGPHFSAPVITFLSGPEEIAPVIILHGANPIWIAQGAVWREPGYTALDRNDMDISSLVAITGNVDTGAPGEYRLVYEVVAEDSEISARVERVVHVTAEASTSPDAVPLPPPMVPEDMAPAMDAPPGIMSPAELPYENAPNQERPTPVPSSVNTIREFPDLSPYRPITDVDMKDARHADSMEMHEEEGGHAESTNEDDLSVQETAEAAEVTHRETVVKEKEGRINVADKEIHQDPTPARLIKSVNRVDIETTGLEDVAGIQPGNHWLIKVGVLAVGALVTLAGWRWAYGVRSRHARRKIAPKK